MEPKANLQLVEPLRKTLKQFNKNNQCIYPDCNEKPIGSHVIAESVLKLLADQGKVLTLERSDDNVIVNTIHGHTWDHTYRQSKSIGIGTQATYPIFCSRHDNNVFEPLEKPGFSHEPQKVALLAYRALCYKTWNKNLEKKLSLFLADKDDETVQQNFRLLSHKILLEARQKFGEMLETRDYRQMRWIKRVLRIDRCFACTGAIIPYFGDEDIINIGRGNAILTSEDIVTFTFFPEKNLNASVCTITWFRDNIRGEQFREGFELDHPLEVVVRNNIITNALNMPLVYISPTWWNTLTPEQQDTLLEFQLRKRFFIFGEFGTQL